MPALVEGNPSGVGHIADHSRRDQREREGGRIPVGTAHHNAPRLEGGRTRQWEAVREVESDNEYGHHSTRALGFDHDSHHRVQHHGEDYSRQLHRHLGADHVDHDGCRTAEPRNDVGHLHRPASENDRVHGVEYQAASVSSQQSTRQRQIFRSEGQEDLAW